MVCCLEVRRHATVDLAVLLDPAAERHALQVALERVAPLVVRADEFLAVAVPLAAEAHAAVRADVLDDVERAVGIAREDHRAFADHGALVVARIRHLGFQADIAPVVLVEEAFEFLAVDRLVGVGEERDAVGAVAFPHRLGGKDRGGFIHGLVSLSSAGHPDFDRAQPLDLAAHHVARHHRVHAFGRAGHDDVARLERLVLGQAGHALGH